MNFCGIEENAVRGRISGKKASLGYVELWPYINDVKLTWHKPLRPLPSLEVVNIKTDNCELTYGT